MGLLCIMTRSSSAKMAVVFMYSSTGSVQVVSTASTNDKCTQSFSGTSAACPLAAGVIALALEANNNLTWRYVKYLLVYTSNTTRLSQSSGEWFLNSGGLYFTHQFGFGAIDAEALVNRARYWVSVPEQVQDTIVPTGSSVVVTAGASQSISFRYQGPGVGYVEQVEARMTLKPQGLSLGSGRGDILITLQSPSLTTSTLLFKRPYDNDRTVGYSNWPLCDCPLLGEDPRGGWTLTVRYDGTSGQIVLTGLSITIYGTASTPVAVSHIMPASCGSGYYRNASTLECTSSCGYAMRDGYCYDPMQPEESCVRVMLPSGGAMQRGGDTAVAILMVLTLFLSSCV